MAPSDSDRAPPVLAHQRFLEDKDSFAGLNPAQRFQRIRDTNLWGAAASASGLGSEMNATTVLRAELTRLLKRLGVVSLLDAPCGDAGWINQADLDVRYAGVDIVPSLIEALQARAAAGEIVGEYRLADITRDSLPRCDAINPPSAGPMINSATKQSSFVLPFLDCFAEPVIGRAFARPVGSQ
jgi:hypothetical protein